MNVDLEVRVAKLRSFKKAEEIHDFLLAGEFGERGSLPDPVNVVRWLDTFSKRTRRFDAG